MPYSRVFFSSTDRNNDALICYQLPGRQRVVLKRFGDVGGDYWRALGMWPRVHGLVARLNDPLVSEAFKAGHLTRKDIMEIINADEPR